MQSNVFVVFAGFRVAKNIGNLLLVSGAEHERGIVEGLLGQKGQRGWLDLQDVLTFKLCDRDKVAAQQAIFGVIFTEWKRILVIEGFIRHFFLTCNCIN